MVVPSLFNDMNLDITCILVAVPGLGRYYQHWIMLALKFKFNLKILCKVKFCNLKSSRLKCIPWRKRSIQDIMDSVGSTYEIASQVWSKKITLHHSSDRAKSWNEHQNAEIWTLWTLNVQTSDFLNITFWSKIELRTCRTSQKTEQFANIKL